MKQLFLSCLLLFVTCSVFAQRVESPEEVNIRLDKAGQKLQSGSSLMVGGVALAALGVLLASSKSAKESTAGQTAGLAVVGLGGAMVFVGYIKIGSAGKQLRKPQ